MLAYTRSSVPIGMAALASLLFAAGPATAQGVQDKKLLVKAFIGEVCSVTTATLDFGPDIDVQANTDAIGSIEVDCGTETTLGVELDGGDNFNFGNRAMAGAGNPLLYDLYKDAARQNAWGVGEEVVATINGAGSVSVYGRIPIQNNGHAPGEHTDEVQITLNF